MQVSFADAKKRRRKQSTHRMRPSDLVGPRFRRLERDQMREQQRRHDPQRRRHREVLSALASPRIETFGQFDRRTARYDADYARVPRHERIKPRQQSVINTMLECNGLPQLECDYATRRGERFALDQRDIQSHPLGVASRTCAASVYSWRVSREWLRELNGNCKNTSFISKRYCADTPLYGEPTKGGNQLLSSHQPHTTSPPGAIKSYAITERRHPLVDGGGDRGREERGEDGDPELRAERHQKR